MNIVIASGKGGAGKTSVAASLVAVWERPLIAVDADVEAPNLHLFLNPTLSSSETVSLRVPELDLELCTSCGLCRDICHYGAIARFASRLSLFPDMCHGCGGCFAVCPQHALREGQRVLGVLENGLCRDDKVRFLMGRSRIGEAMTPPLLRALHKKLHAMQDTIPSDALVDAPPGVSCPAMSVAREADAVLLVVEPTPFGFHDFCLAHQAFTRLNKPLLVVLNRVGMFGNQDGEQRVRAYCKEHALPVAATFPFSREAAETYAHGGLLAHLSPEWNRLFAALALTLTAFGTGGNHA
ncbi:MAG: ATP-binding protein [Bilophila sp.]